MSISDHNLTRYRNIITGVITRATCDVWAERREAGAAVTLSVVINIVTIRSVSQDGMWGPHWPIRGRQRSWVTNQRPGLWQHQHTCDRQTVTSESDPYPPCGTVYNTDMDLADTFDTTTPNLANILEITDWINRSDPAQTEQRLQRIKIEAGRS